MWLEQVMFFVAALLAVAGALGVVVLRNPFYSVLALVGHLFALAILFLLLSAEFLAAAQVVVYAGAVMVLYVFVVAYVGGVEEAMGDQSAPRRLGPLFAAALFVELCFAVIGTGLSAIDTRGAETGEGFGSPGQIGELLLSKFLIPFEGASFLLLIAAVGAVLLARRRRGLEEEGGREPARSREAGGREPGSERGAGGPAEVTQ